MAELAVDSASAEKKLEKAEDVGPSEEQDGAKLTVSFYCKWGLAFITALYFFLFGLAVMGDAFKALSGKEAASLMGNISNPVAGVMVGIMVTVLLQSSSTTTSIVTSMVGAEILGVQTAIPVIMGANIGTSVTNTLVAHGQVNDVEQFQRAFAGATIHDMFNMLSVLTLLPIELVTRWMGGGLLFEITEAMTEGLEGMDSTSTFESPIKTIVSPLSKLVIVPDKDVIKQISLGCQSCIPTPFLVAAGSNATFPYPQNATDTTWCSGVKMESNDWANWKSTFVDKYWAADSYMSEGGSPCYSEAGMVAGSGCEIYPCFTEEQWTEKYADGALVKGGYLLDILGSKGAAAAALVISLVALCTALYVIVYALQKLVMSSGGKGKIISKMQKILDYPYLSMVFGMVLTICVQSSSITTSTLTPLVGMGVITLAQMLPLTLGANIGTTCTALLASMVSMKRDAIQIALCHLCFNIFGILIWFPLPVMRRVPTQMAVHMGNMVVLFRWFGMFYIFYAFVTVPLFILAISQLFDLGVAGVVFGVILTAAVLAAAMGGIYKFPLIVAFIRTKMGRTNEVVTPAAGISESAARGLELRAGSAASV